MKIVTNLEYRKFEENAYDFVDASGKRQSGVSKAYIFMTEDDEVLKVGLPKDTVINVDMVKGKSYDVHLDVKLKPVVDKNSNVSQKQFYSYFQLLDVVVNPFEQKKVEDKNNAK